MQTEREKIKQSFIEKKGACRSNALLLNDNLRILKEKELKDLQVSKHAAWPGGRGSLRVKQALNGYCMLTTPPHCPNLPLNVQEEYREVDAEFKALGVVVEKDTLMDGRSGQRGGREFDPTRAKNEDLLNSALSTQKDTTSKLKSGLATLEATKEQAKYTAAQLAEGQEKLKRIDQGLDEVQSELELSRVLMTRFVKRLYTDRVVIAFTALLVLGLAGIIAYSVLNPDQKIFNVPDEVKPNMIPGVSPSASPSAHASGGSVRLLRGLVQGPLGL